MSAITINQTNLQRYHNAIIYGASENEIREHFKEAIGCGKPDGMPLAQLVTIINNYRNDIENRYNTFFKAKVRTIDEYNKANPDKKMEHVLVYVYGKSKDFAECIELLACMQKSWAAGYHFAIGVTDGNNPGTKGCIGITADAFTLKDFYQTTRLSINNYGNFQVTVDVDNNVNNDGKRSTPSKLNE